MAEDDDSPIPEERFTPEPEGEGPEGEAGDGSFPLPGSGRAG